MPTNILDFLLFSANVDVACSSNPCDLGAGIGMRRASIQRDVGKAAVGLCQLGFRPGDRLAVWSETRYEWLIAELAAMLAGGSVVGIDPHGDLDYVQFVIEHSQPTALIVDNWHRKEAIPQEICSRFKFFATFTAPATSVDAPSWSEILANTRERCWSARHRVTTLLPRLSIRRAQPGSPRESNTRIGNSPLPGKQSPKLSHNWLLEIQPFAGCRCAIYFSV